MASLMPILRLQSCFVILFKSSSKVFSSSKYFVKRQALSFLASRGPSVLDGHLRQAHTHKELVFIYIRIHMIL